MTYKIKEIFYSIQGEGFHVGRPTVFLRFAGCNLWSGHEKDRSKAICNFCDTDFVGVDGEGGGTFKSANELAGKVRRFWPNKTGTPYVVCTGGEPMLQLDNELVLALARLGFEVGIETNGTIPIPFKLDWVCVSPKADSVLKVFEGDELKLVYPQEENDPKDFEGLKFKHFYLQPKDSHQLEVNRERAKQYCLYNPKWKLSLQIHKVLGIK